jgi:hypothetical protein
MHGSIAHDTSVRSADRGASAVARPMRAIALPVLSLLITGAVHFSLEAVWPDLKTTFIPPVLAPLLLAYGVWVGYRVVEAGGGYIGGIVAGAVVGLLPLALDIVGFGIILGRGTTPGALAGIFGFSMVLFGSLIGSGVAAGRPSDAGERPA